MAGQKFEPGRRGAKQLVRHLDQHGKGTVVYTVATARNWGIGEERTYTEHVFDWRAPFTGHWMTGHKSAEGLLATEGAVYTHPPRGVRNGADPAPQVAGPGGHGEHFGVLDEAEIRSLNKRLRDAPDPRTRRI